MMLHVALTVSSLCFCCFFFASLFGRPLWEWPSLQISDILFLIDNFLPNGRNFGS